MINLKSFRKDKDIKQKEICELLNIAQPYLSAIERGERPLSKDKFSALHKHYGDVLFNYKNADIVIEHRAITEKKQPSDNDERSRFLSIIENQQKTIEHQQRILDGLQKRLHPQEAGDEKKVEELQQYSNQLEAGLALAKNVELSPLDTPLEAEDTTPNVGV